MDLEELKKKYQEFKMQGEAAYHKIGCEVLYLIERCEKAEAKLAEMEKQEPVGYMVRGNFFHSLLTAEKSAGHVTANHENVDVVPVYALPVPQQSEWQASPEDIERWLNEFAIWFFNTVPVSLSAYSRSEGRWLSDDIERRWQSYLKDRKSLWNSMRAISQLPPITK